jgi:hypothetical protein
LAAEALPLAVLQPPADSLRARYGGATNPFTAASTAAAASGVWVTPGVPFGPRPGLSMRHTLPLGTLFDSSVMHRTHLCHTISGNPVPLLTITDFASGPAALACRPYIILSGRVHPGETNGSWMLRGVIDFLTSSAPVAVELRRRVIFKVIPMLNPDGVINGHHRTNLAGLDLNRHWTNPDMARAPTIWHLRHLILTLQARAAAAGMLAESLALAPLAMEDLQHHDAQSYVQLLLGACTADMLAKAAARGFAPEPAPAAPAAGAAALPAGAAGSVGGSTGAGRAPSAAAAAAAGAEGPLPSVLRILPPLPQPVLLFVDFHGHSRRQDVFTFGCHEFSHDGAPPIPGEIQRSDATPANPSSRLFPRLLAARVDTFSYKGCSWRVQKEKYNCARVAMWRDACLTASYTIEATFGGSTAASRSGVHMSTHQFEEVGHAFCLATLDWLDGPTGSRHATGFDTVRRLAGQAPPVLPPAAQPLAAGGGKGLGGVGAAGVLQAPAVFGAPEGAAMLPALPGASALLTDDERRPKSAAAVASGKAATRLARR